VNKRTKYCRLAVRRSLALLALVLCLAGHASGDEVIDRIVAVAGGDLITQSDVAAARVLGLLPSGVGATAALETRDIVARLIDRSLMLAEVDRYAPPEPSADAVDRAVAAVRARFPTAEAFARALAEVGMNDKYLRDRLRENLRLRAYLEERFTVPSPSDDEIAAYYALQSPSAPLDAVRSDVAAAIVAARRQTLVDEWVAGLRRRAQITELDLTDR